MQDPIIESGIPLPEDQRSQTAYPFAKMNVGDSIFFILSPSDNAQRMKNRLAQASRGFGKKQEPEWKFVIRYRLEDEISGVRVWRSL
jgi:hypothetical protein|tara:strand:+ start:375 stop:635 length:261 start_codon:yes stop_codon:yes gene_type:complete